MWLTGEENINVSKEAYSVWRIRYLERFKPSQEHTGKKEKTNEFQEHQKYCWLKVEDAEEEECFQTIWK